MQADTEKPQKQKAKPQTSRNFLPRFLIRTKQAQNDTREQESAKYGNERRLILCEKPSDGWSCPPKYSREQ